jgi:hypothetical protein
LDASVNSLSYLCVLRTRIEAYSNSKSKATTASEVALMRKAIHFLNNFDGVQMRYTGNELRKIVDFVVERASRTNLVR